jgi:hypothetical protein
MPRMSHTQPAPAAVFELRYAPLSGRVALSFPCDSAGRVDLGRLSERARANYLLACTLIGRDYAVPVVQAVHDDGTSPSE